MCIDICYNFYLIFVIIFSCIQSKIKRINVGLKIQNQLLFLILAYLKLQITTFMLSL